MASKKSSKKPSAPAKKSSIKTPKVKAKVAKVIVKAKANLKTKLVARKPVAAKARVVTKAPVAAKAPVVANAPVAVKRAVPVQAKILKPTLSPSVEPKKALKAAVIAKPVAPIAPARAGKNEPGLNVRALEEYRKMLLTKRHELLGDVSSMEEEALRSSGQSNLSNLPIHMADMGTDNYEQEFTLGLVEKDRNLLRDINTALAKINAGTYGICEGTGKPINKARLDAQPWARFSIEHARTLEQRRMRA